LAELNKLKDGCEKLKDGYEKLKAGYDKLKHDYDSRETTVNACLRENQKRDIEVENLKKDNEDQVKELKVKLEEALTRSVHDMYPDMVREYIKLFQKLARFPRWGLANDKFRLPPSCRPSSKRAEILRLETRRTG
jgi:chromosome segregation ATPase